MSGVEVVGFVLGAIPLLISGLEHYADGLRTMKNMWNYEAVLTHLVSEFELANGIFRHSCQDLLMPVLPDAEAMELLEGKSPNWDSSDLDERLRTRLGSDYQPYTRAVRVLRRHINLFTRKLGLDDKTMLPPWISSFDIVDRSVRDKFFKNAWHRIKGGFDTPAVSTLLDKIKSSVNQISTFTRGSISIAPKRILLKQRTNGKYWLSVRHHASRLYESLNSRWACACPYEHRVSLRLEACGEPSVSDDDKITFNVLFSFDLHPLATNSASLPWNWRSLDVKSSQRIETQTNLTASSTQSSSKRVTFDPRHQYRSRNQSPLGPNLASSAFTPPARSSVAEVTDLCEILKQLPQTTCCVGYLGDTASQHHLYTTAHRMTTEDAQEVISFYEVLRTRGNYGLGVKDKYWLALAMASAVLRLYATPWLQEKWRLEEIHFLRRKATEPLTGHAYVSRNFASPSGPQQQPTSKSQISQTHGSACVANESIFALGVALIEISFGVPIISLKDPVKDPDLPGFTEFCIATRLVHENVIKERDHDNYAEVVLRCVKGQLSVLSSSLSLEEVKVQQSFYEDVVLPLLQLYDELHKKDGSHG